MVRWILPVTNSHTRDSSTTESDEDPIQKLKAAATIKNSFEEEGSENRRKSLVFKYFQKGLDFCAIPEGSLGGYEGDLD